MLGGMEPTTLDHIALWVSDRDTIADFLTTHTDMHVIDRTDKFTLVGTDARRGKLTLFAAEGPREPLPLEHVGLRVSDLADAESRLPDGLELDRADGRVAFEVSEGLRLALVEAPTDVEYDLDHVALNSAAPADTAKQYLALGFEQASPAPSGAPRVEVGGAWVEFHEGAVRESEKPLLNHLAVLVDSADQHLNEAKEIGVEVADFVDAPNTLAVFLWGPERVKIEYVEHKPSFSLT
jgi:catechol 2,3-dioxygenase-like lactoylglutathione lyase family enzyme